MRPIFLWRTLPLTHRHKLPKRPGLYAVKSFSLFGPVGRVKYIGRATDLKGRWQGRGHHRYPQARNLLWPRLAYIELPKHKINEEEERLIAKLSPPWNGSPVPARWWVGLRGTVATWLGLVLVGIVIVEVLGG